MSATTVTRFEVHLFLLLLYYCTTNTAKENPSNPTQGFPVFHHDGEPLTVVAPGNIRLYANIMVSVIFIITDTENHCFFQSAAPVVVVVVLVLD
jgi:uncharacterized PurR-regulated membrane protein YhhQ (DUF165 family)